MEELKAAGNEHYKMKRYKAAVDSYSLAIQIDESCAALYTNRAAACLMLLQYKEAVADCDRAIKL
jgi:tetratricopeptide (TPR) repeat protein